MMTRAAGTGHVPREWLWFGTIVTAVYGTWAVIIHAGQFHRHVDLLTAGAAIDLLGVVTLAYWLIVVRRGIASTRTVLTVFALSMLGARLLLPASAVARLDLMRIAIAPIEIGIIAWLILKLRRTRSSGSGDLADRVNEICAAVIPSRLVARAVASEMSTLAYAFSSSRGTHASGHPPTHAGDAVESFNVTPSLSSAMMWALVGVVLVEIVPVHLLISRYSVHAAWVVTVLSVWSAVWIVGHFRAIIARKCELRSDLLAIRVGLRCDVSLPLTAIQSVTPLTWRDASALPRSVMSPSRPQSPNVLVALKSPHPVAGPLGFSRVISQIALRLNDPDAFVSALATHVTSGI